MKKTFLLLFSLLTIQFIQSQINVTANSNATQLAQQLAGVGVTIANATITCPNNHSGTFTNAPSALGISDGVVLASGLVTDIPDSPNNFASTGANTAGDADLDSLLADLGETYGTEDACVLEFDITVIGDTLNFHYVMGSEEYPEFVCSSVNDIFGFFISGPNPAGGVYDNVNVALIPNTTIPVSINTINDGGTGGAATCYDGTYSAFYNDTVTGIVYDGNTVTLEASANTVPCGTYHFKLAIGDGGDAIFDSGVFLEAGSFSSNGLLVSTSSILGQGFTTMVEGCVDGEITFALEGGPNTSGFPFSIPMSYTGSAIAGSDYIQLPDTVWIAPGDSFASIQVTGITDANPESLEEILINVIYPCGTVQVASLEIADVIPVEIEMSNDSICIGDTIQLEFSGANIVFWNTMSATYTSSQFTDTTLVVPTTTETYQVFYSLGTCVGQHTDFDISVSNLTAVLNPTPISCPDANDGIISIVAGSGTGSINYNWNTGATTSSLTNLSPNLYQVEVSDNVCTKNLEYDMLNPATVLAEITSSDITSINMVEGCVESTVTYTLVSGINITGSPYPVVIDFGGTATEGVDYSTMPDTVFIAPGQSTVTININSITDALNEGSETLIALITFPLPCGNYAADTIELNDPSAINVFISDSIVCENSFVSLSVFGNFNVSWAPASLFFNPNSNFVNFNPTESVDITLSYSIGTCNFTRIIPITVTEPPSFDVVIKDATCVGVSDGSITLTPTSGILPIFYSWFTFPDTNYINNLAPGFYNLSAFDANNCSFFDFYEISDTILSLSINSQDSIICKGESINFETNDNLPSFATYIWEPSSEFDDNTIKNATTLGLSQTTKFILKGITVPGCEIADTFDIIVENLEIEADYLEKTVSTGEETAIGVQVTDEVNVQTINYTWTPTDYLLNTDIQSTTTTPEDNITYLVIANSENCIDSATIKIIVGIEFDMPNAFTPNNDGINDIFNPVVRGGEIVEFRIYNRWGKKVHDNAKSGWDGKLNEKLQQTDSYTYYIKVTNKIDTQEKLGSFTLIK